MASMALRPIVETLMRSCFDAGAGMGRDWTEREALGEGLERCKEGVRVWLVENGGWVEGLEG